MEPRLVCLFGVVPAMTFCIGLYRRRFRNTRPVQRLPSTWQQSSEKTLTSCRPLLTIQFQSIQWGIVKKKLQIYSMHIIIISCLLISIFGICLCRYRPKANRKMNRQRRCRHAVSGFLRLLSGVRWREGCVVIHRPAPTAQTVR